MPLPSSVVWECRPTGSSTHNGAGFDPASVNVGTDYSRQAAPQILVTDGVCNSTTTVTSATANFDQTHVGNVIGVISGGSFVGFWKIVTVSNSTTVIVHENLTFTGGSVTLRVGGASILSSTGLPMLQNGGAGPSATSGNKIWVKGDGDGTSDYGLSTNGCQIAGTYSNSNPLTVEGYVTTRGDGESAWIARTSSTINILTVSGQFAIVKNLICDGTSAGNSALLLSGGANTILNCKFIAGDDAASVTGAGNVLLECDFQQALTGAFNADVSGFLNEFISCTFHSAAAGGGGVRILDRNHFASCLIYDNPVDGIIMPSTAVYGTHFINCIIWDNGRDGIRNSSTAANGILTGLHFRRCIFGKNLGYDINYSVSDISANTGAIQWAANYLDCNAFYTTGLGKMNNLPANSGDLTLTSSPFVSDTDFTLTGSTGGVAITDNPCTTTLYDGNSLSFLMGASGNAQSTASGSIRSLWRELTGEKDTTSVPNSTVDLYIEAGLEALNRRVGYHLTTDTSSITLVDGTEEYSLPTDCIELLWVEWNGKLLQKADMEQWQQRGINWRGEKKGVPTEWAMYGNKVIFYTKPDAATVAAEDNPVMRYISTPADFTVNGPSQLSTQDYRVVVYYGVAEFSRSYPDSPFASKRADDYDARFEKEAALIASYYKTRMLER